MNLRLSLSVLPLTLLTLTTWGGPVSASQEPQSSHAPSPTDEYIPTVEDQSLTPLEYIKLGLPAYDRDWSESDLARAVKVFKSFEKNEKPNLPRYQSKRSGEVFARMTSTENFEQFKDRDIPLKIRFPQAVDYYESCSQIFKLYLSAYSRNEVGDSELVELFGMVLRYTVVILELVEEFTPTLDKNDPTYPTRMEGLEQMERGLANVVGGAMETLSERKSYRFRELLKLLGYMQETFPIIVPSLTPASRAEVIVRLNEMQNDEEFQDFQPGLGELCQKVRQAVEKE